MLLAFASGGRSDTKLIVKPYTFEQLYVRLSTPRVGQKDGSYYIRGGDLIEDKRADENLRSAELVIIDGDSSFDPETGEITPGAPPLESAIEALRAMGVAFIAHTSHSARPAEGFWKYRIIIPAKTHNPEELRACVDFILAQLHGRGVWLSEVVENYRWSQPWYLPRVSTPDELNTFQSYAHEGEAFDVQAAIAWAKEKAARERKEETLPSAPPVSKFLRDEESPIRNFNQKHGLDWVRSTLEAQGYRFSHFDRSKNAYRYIRPGSETQTAGVVLMQGKYGDWITYSHHGGADPLSGRVCDPFSLFATFKHNGDLKAAARSLRPSEPSIAERIAERAAQPKQAAPEPFVTEEMKQPGKQPQPFALVPWSDLRDVEARWLIDDLMPEEGLSALYGRPGSYKSFVALYAAAMVATGRPCFGRETKQGAVVYIAGEGGAGLARRRNALIRKYGLADDVPVYFLRAQLNLRSSLDDMQKLVAAVEALGISPALVIIDTLARAFAGGNENASEDMGAFISVVGALQETLRCAVMFVHHSGKDEARGMRGHSNLLGAVDAELEVKKISPEGSSERIGELTVTKQKDGEDGYKIAYRMDLVPLSEINPDASSLVVVPIEGDAPEKQKPIPEGARLVLAALQMAIEKSPQYPTHEEIPRGMACAKTEVWRSYFYQASPLDRESARKAFNRGIQMLQKLRKSGTWGEFSWLVGDG